MFTVCQEYFIRNLQSLAGSNLKSVSLVKKSTKSRKSIFRKNRKTKRLFVRYSIITLNLAIVTGVGLVAISTKQNSSSPLNFASSQVAFQSDEMIKPLDSLSSADVAVHVARLTGLQETVAVVNKADTVNAQLAVAAADEVVVAKPQIVGAGLKSKKDIIDYKVVEGDTVSNVAAKFGINADTIRLSNGITGEALSVGRDLVISPINGIVYTVKAGDTADSLASKHFANKDNLLVFNDAEETGVLKAGDRIVIPDGVAPAAPVVVARSVSPAASSYSTSSFSFGTAAQYGANGYDYGWCTWHAANRRIEIGRPIPSNLGNAISWLSVARRVGIPTGDVPQAGAVVYHKNIGGLGHVAFVEKVNEDGSALVSDMNYPSWGRVTYRTITPAEFGSYAFIY